MDGLRLIGDLVRRLDGIPLAIELAAGRLSTFSLADLAQRLDRALDLLGSGRAAPKPGTGRCARRSNGPTSSSTPASGCCSGTCRCSPTAST